MVYTYKLAKTKGYKVGDEISWHVSGNNKYYTSKIVGFNKDPQNQNVTMTRKYLESLDIEYKPDSLYTNVDLSENKDIVGVTVISNINLLSYVIAAIGTFVISYVVSKLLAKKIRKIDMVSSLKGNE